MATSLIQSIQQNLGIAPIKKIDPNTQGVSTGNTASIEKHTVEQAALPTVLAGLYKMSTTHPGSETILKGTSDNWVDTIFKTNTAETVNHVASYAGTNSNEAYDKMEWIAKEAVNVIRQHMKNKDDHSGLMSYLASQRRDILTYLPAEIHAGELLNDNTLDDRTNKMEGPMSNMLKMIGNFFTSSEGPADNTHRF